MRYGRNRSERRSGTKKNGAFPSLCCAKFGSVERNWFQKSEALASEVKMQSNRPAALRMGFSLARLWPSRRFNKVDLSARCKAPTRLPILAHFTKSDAARGLANQRLSISLSDPWAFTTSASLEQ